jgi:hypothetical protein
VGGDIVSPGGNKEAVEMSEVFRHYDAGTEDGDAGTVRVAVRTTTGSTRMVDMPRSDVVGNRAKEVLRSTLDELAAGHGASDEDGGEVHDIQLADDVRALLMDPNCAVELRDGSATAQPVGDHTTIGNVENVIFEVARDHVGG